MNSKVRVDANSRKTMDLKGRNQLWRFVETESTGLDLAGVEDWVGAEFRVAEHGEEVRMAISHHLRTNCKC